MIEDFDDDFDLESLGLEDDEDDTKLLLDDIINEDEDHILAGAIDRSGLFIPVEEEVVPETLVEDLDTPLEIPDSPVIPVGTEVVKPKRTRRSKAEMEEAEKNKVEVVLNEQTDYYPESTKVTEVLEDTCEEQGCKCGDSEDLEPEYDMSIIENLILSGRLDPLEIFEIGSLVGETNATKNSLLAATNAVAKASFDLFYKFVQPGN